MTTKRQSDKAIAGSMAAISAKATAFAASFIPLALALLLAALLAGCAGSNAPTPPAMMGEAPQSIMADQPPADDPATQNAAYQLQTAAGDQNALPPASDMPDGTAKSGNQLASAGQYTPPASQTVITFEPMVGAPKTVARELSQSLGLRVAQQALPVVPRSDAKVTHRVKGYFSANASGGDCVISYVWDIFDKNGKRINRVTGSQKTAMVSNDPWDAVKGPVLDQVAVDTAAKLKTWHASFSPAS